MFGRVLLGIGLMLNACASDQTIARDDARIEAAADTFTSMDGPAIDVFPDDPVDRAVSDARSVADAPGDGSLVCDDAHDAQTDDVIHNGSQCGGPDSPLPRFPQGDYECVGQPDCYHPPDRAGCPAWCQCLCFCGQCFGGGCVAISCNDAGTD